MTHARQKIGPRPTAPATRSTPPAPSERRRMPVRHRPDRRNGGRPLPRPIREEWLPDEEDGRWGAAVVVDPDFDDFGEDLGHIVGHVPNIFEDDEPLWPTY